MNTIIERTKGWGEYELQKLQQFISLVMLVENNYYHIQELETVKDLLGSYQSAYNNQYYPNIPVAAKIASEIAETTRWAHYDDKVKESDYYLPNVIAANIPGLNLSYNISMQKRQDEYREAGRTQLMYS